MDAGRADASEQAGLENIQKQLAYLNTAIQRHALWEEKAVHPLLRQKIPGVSERIEAEHKTLNHNLENLVQLLDAAIALPAAYEKRGQVMQEFYLAFNRFAMVCLDHIGYEEEQIEPNMWNLCTKQELLTALLF